MAQKDGIPHMLYSIMIDSNFGWKIVVEKKVLLSSVEAFSTQSQQLVSLADVLGVLEYIESCNFCVGNEDSHYAELQLARQGEFMDLTGLQSNNRLLTSINQIILNLGSKEVAYYDRDLCSFPTIRCSDCCLLVPPGVKRCKRCRQYRKTLNSMLSRQRRNASNHSEDPTAASSHTNYRFLNTVEKEKRMQHLHQTAKVQNA